MPNITLSVTDFFLTQERFDLVENKEFGFLETHPMPLYNLATYYISDDYISHSNKSNTLFEKIYQIVKRFNLNYKFSLISSKEVNNSLLDYGCGTGDFLAYSKKKGKTVYGIEPNEKALKIAQQKVGKELVSDKTLFELDQQFDIISLWHVLEHIPNLYEFIDELKVKLSPEGEILIAVPNHHSFDAKFYKSYWAAYDVPRHLWHFTPESLEKLFLKHGMKVERKFPLWFDSFYVCLLSEKYKKTKLGFVRAIFIAALSNLLAVFTKNYSSVVFRVKKYK